MTAILYRWRSILVSRSFEIITWPARRRSCRVTGIKNGSRRPRMRHEKCGEVFDDFGQSTRRKRHIDRKGIPLLYLRCIRGKGGR